MGSIPIPVTKILGFDIAGVVTAFARRVVGFDSLEVHQNRSRACVPPVGCPAIPQLVVTLKSRAIRGKNGHLGASAGYTDYAGSIIVGGFDSL